MKQQCLATVSTTKRMKTQIEDCTNEDKISKLPDDIILRILSNLPAEQMISTSILSRRWKHVWKKSDTLKFNSDNHKQGFLDNVLRALHTHNNPILRNLEIAVKYDCDSVDLGMWTAIAYSRNVVKLVLILNAAPGFVIFPATVLRRHNTLEILKLAGKIIFNIPMPGVSLRTLKELHLYHAKFEDEDTVSNLFGGCSGLEKLVVQLYTKSGVGMLEINIPSLQSLTIGSFYCDEERFVISAPRLEHLNILKFHGVRSIAIENAPELRTANIAYHKRNMEENILASLTSAIRLSIHSSTKYPSGQYFYSLLTLELKTDGGRWCRFLVRMLEGSPNLQNLKLNGGYYVRDFPTWDEPDRVPECLLHTLETLFWSSYTGYGEDDYSVAKYILKSAYSLKKATFVMLEKYDEEMGEITSNLANVVRASSQCQLLFDYRSDDSLHESSDDDSDLENFESE